MFLKLKDYQNNTTLISVKDIIKISKYTPRITERKNILEDAKSIITIRMQNKVEHYNDKTYITDSNCIYSTETIDEIIEKMNGLIV